MGQGRDVVISLEGVVLDLKPDGSMSTILLRVGTLSTTLARCKDSMSVLFFS